VAQLLARRTDAACMVRIVAVEAAGISGSNRTDFRNLGCSWGNRSGLFSELPSAIRRLLALRLFMWVLRKRKTNLDPSAQGLLIRWGAFRGTRQLSSPRHRGLCLLMFLLAGFVSEYIIQSFNHPNVLSGTLTCWFVNAFPFLSISSTGRYMRQITVYLRNNLKINK